MFLHVGYLKKVGTLGTPLIKSVKSRVKLFPLAWHNVKNNGYKRCKKWVQGGLMSDKPLPNQEQVRLIFKETYLLYTKYIKLESIDWDMFHKEYVELCNKYPFDLNIQIIVELIEIIGAEKS